jgi:hypothetical protein
MEVITSYVLFNGLQVMYTMSYVGNTMLFYWEIQHKLGYLFHRTAPSRQEVLATASLVNKSTEVIGNSYTLANTSSKLAKNRNLSRESKMQSQSYYQWFCHQIEEFRLARLQARQLKRDKAQLKLEEYQLRLEKEQDAREEVRMVDLGFTRCKRCSYYSAPDLMLDMISVAALKCAADLKSFGPEDMEELKQLILNSDRRKPRVPSDFKKYRAVFVCVETPCRRCKSAHTKLHTPESICELQKPKIALLRENMQVIRFEHDVI